MAQDRVHVELTLGCHQENVGHRHQRGVLAQPERPRHGPLASLGEVFVVAGHQARVQGWQEYRGIAVDV
jgi:hypothetical protein